MTPHPKPGLLGLDAEKAGGRAANRTVGTWLACRMFPELQAASQLVGSRKGDWSGLWPHCPVMGLTLSL